MSHYSLADFIPTYPERDVSSFQWDISSKKEFNQLISYPESKDIIPVRKRTNAFIAPTHSEEKCFDDSKFFEHQRIVMRLIQHYPRLLLIAETGTGKSCSFVAPSEYFRKCFAGRYRKAYILEHNETNCDVFIGQVQDSCAVGEFKDKKSAMRWYKAMTYNKFVNHEMSFRNAEGEYELFSDSELVARFSGCLFLIDEAHNLRRSESSSSQDTESVFSNLKRLFSLIKRFKLIVATATPMFNSPEEIIRIAELLGGEDIKIKKNFDWESDDLSFLDTSIKGRVSYIRSADTGILISPQGKKIPLPDKSIYKGQLSDFKRQPITAVIPLEVRGLQLAHLQKIKQRGLFGEVDPENQPFSKEESNGFSFVFPLENIREGEDVYSRFVKSDVIGGKKKFFFSDERAFSIPGKERLFTLREYVSDFERLKGISIKIAFILKCELRYALNRGAIKARDYLSRFNIDFEKEDFEGEYTSGDMGTSFIYTTGLSSYGAKLIAIIFEIYGFEMYSRSGNILEGGVPIVPKKLRFGLHIGENSNVESLGKLFNCDANFHGEYVQCYIGSKIARDAISLFNATRMYKYVPDWHESGNHQANSRIIRARSHVLLTEEKGERVVVKTYNLASYLPLEKHPTFDFENTDFNGSTYSTDVKLYLIAEMKDFRIRRVMKYLKVRAVDCMINYPRNVRISDVEGDKECDFGECFYRCENGRDIPPDEIKKNLILELESGVNSNGLAGGQGPSLGEYDFSTYDILYSDEIIEKIELKILESVTKRGILSFSEMILFFEEKYHLEGYTLKNIERYVFEAVDRRITSKAPFLDNYGYQCYLQTDGNHIFIQREFPRRSDISKSDVEGELYGQIGYYSTQLVGLMKNGLVQSLQANPSTKIREGKGKKHPFNVENLSLLTKEGIIEYIFGEKYTESDRIGLFEDVISNEGEYPKNVVTTIKEYYHYYFNEFKEPTKALKEILLQINAVKQGNQSKNLKDRTVNFKKVDLTQNGEKVYIHVLNRDVDNKDYNRTIFYRASQTEKKMRVLIPSQSKEWREMIDVEFKLYPKLFEEEHLRRISFFARKKYYGIVYYSSKGEQVFAIAANEVKNDGREQMRGGRCTTKTLSDIISFLINEDLTPKDISEEEITYPKKKMMKDYLSIKEFSYDEKNLEEVYISTILSEKKISFEEETLRNAFEWYLYFTREPAKGESKHKASQKNRISECCNIFYSIYEKEKRLVFYPYI